MTYKILNNLVSVDKDYNYFLLLTLTLHVLMDSSCFNTSTGGNSFSQHIINDWNILPCEIVSASNVLIFKTKLDTFLYDRHYNFI